VAKNDLAERLGASRVAVSNALAQLAALGFVKSGYGRVDIPEPAALQVWLSCRNEAHPADAMARDRD
jgi:DNA-binding Lrp family transcriptional regulator